MQKRVQAVISVWVCGQVDSRTRETELDLQLLFSLQRVNAAAPSSANALGSIQFYHSAVYKPAWKSSQKEYPAAKVASSVSTNETSVWKECTWSHLRESKDSRGQRGALKEEIKLAEPARTSFTAPVAKLASEALEMLEEKQIELDSG